MLSKNVSHQKLDFSRLTADLRVSEGPSERTSTRSPTCSAARPAPRLWGDDDTKRTWIWDLMNADLKKCCKEIHGGYTSHESAQNNRWTAIFLCSGDGGNYAETCGNYAEIMRSFFWTK